MLYTLVLHRGKIRTYVPTIKAQTLPRGRALASGEISALMGACGRDSSPAGIRDAALIAVLYGAGLRRSESVGLDISDYNVETGELNTAT
jgi:site-specific recombinase XerD